MILYSFGDHSRLGMYAIVDIETTGGNAGTGSITEIAILISDGREVLHRYSSLVNPMRPIPVFIEKLTGISDAMVEKAPVFGDIAEEVFGLLEGKVFIAHNVNFDFSFVSHQLSQHGYKLQSKKLCTVRLSRKIFEGLPKYSLGHLCRSLGIEIRDRHRAMGDAEATALLFRKLLENDKQRQIEKMLKKGSRDSYLPIHVSETDVEQMPDRPGIYYFHDKKGKVIYVGKAKRLRKRVISHFSNNDVSKRKQELMRLVSKISYKECGNEFMMSVMESIEIKRIWPEFNRSQKKFENKYGICSYIDQKGIIRLGIVKKKKHLPTHITLPLLHDGRLLLQRLSKTHQLCPKMCFLQNEQADCAGVEESYCEGVCENREDIDNYNKKVESAIQEMVRESPQMMVFGEGRKRGEYSCVAIGRNDFLATGYILADPVKVDIDHVMSKLEPAPSNAYVRSLVLAYAEKFPAMARQF